MIKSTNMLVLIVSISIGLLVAAPLKIDTNSLIFHQDNEVFFYSGNSVTKIFSDNKIVLRSKMRNVAKLSPKGNYLTIEGEYRNDVDTDLFFQKVLIIKDLTREIEQRRILEYTYYDWSPREDKLVFIQGERGGQKGPQELVGKSIWIYDSKSDGLRQILINDNAFLYRSVSWEAFDNNIYFQKLVKLDYAYHLGVFRYNPNTGEVQPTPYNSLNFSPEGKYYFVNSEDDNLCALYRRKDNTSIPIKDFGKRQTLRLVEWDVSNDKVFAYVRDYGFNIYKIDCSTGEIGGINIPRGIAPINGLIDIKEGKLFWKKVNNGKMEIIAN